MHDVNNNHTDLNFTLALFIPLYLPFLLFFVFFTFFPGLAYSESKIILNFRVSEIFVPALGVRQENFITCLFDVFSQVIGLNSVCFNSRKVTFSTAEFIVIYICPLLRRHSKITHVQGCPRAANNRKFHLC